jgi:PAS domain S-box-containing protein
MLRIPAILQLRRAQLPFPRPLNPIKPKGLPPLPRVRMPTRLAGGRQRSFAMCLFPRARTCGSAVERPMSKADASAAPTLADRERELRLLVETIPTLVWRAGPEGKFEYVNRRVLEYVGTPLAEVIGWGWMERIHPDDIAFKVSTWLKTLESKDPSDAVCRIRGADGRYRWFDVRGEPLRADDGTILSWYGVLIDIDDRRNAEEALRESEYKLHQIIETMPGLHWSTGPDGEPTQLNRRALDYSGIQFEDFLHLGWKQFLHPDDFSETENAFHHAIQTGTSYQAIHRLRRADGVYRWHQARAEPLRDQRGRIIQWYGVTVDIDEVKKAEEEPRSAAQLQATLNVVPAYTWYAAPSGGLTFVNKRTADYLGFTKDHPLRFGVGIGAEWDAHIPLVHPDDHEETRKVWSTCLRTGEAGELSFRVRNAQGGYRWFLSRAEPLRASDGTLLQWVGVNLDIEELKCAEQALRESEAKFRDYAETASDWFWEIDEDYKFTVLTENAFGSRASDRIGTTCWDHALDLETEPEKWRLVRATLDSRKPFRDFVYCTAGGSGSPMHVRASGKPVFDGEGGFRGYRGTGTDVTATTKAEQALRESEDRLRATQTHLARASQIATVAELSASVAHEINQPLAAIVANAQTCQTWLSGDNPNVARARIAVGRIVRDATAAAEVVRRIRALFRQATPEKSRLHMNEVVQEVWRLLQGEMSRRGVLAEFDLAHELPSVAADRIQLQQVLVNLIRNAAEAMEVSDGPKQLIVRSRHVDGRIVVEVCDFGPGLADKERAFEPFHSTKKNGMGVGLSISRSIIQAHEGELWARDNAPQGTIFTFTLLAP